MTKLTKIINLGIEKGFTVFGWADESKERKIYEWWVSDNKLSIRYKFALAGGVYYKDYSLTDLLFSPGSNLMQAIFGEEDEWYTTECTCGGLDFHAFGHDTHKIECAKCKASRGRIYHLSELAKLNSDEERINYIFDNLEKGLE